MQTIWASDELMAKMSLSSFLDRRLAMIEEKKEKEKKEKNTKLNPEKLVSKL
jgi:hypothetical protein